jgi:hypothetical protein
MRNTSFEHARGAGLAAAARSLALPAALALLAALGGTSAASARAEGGAPAPAAQAQAKKPVTLDDLARRLPDEGLRGTMHGANHETGAYVFTWWDPDDFFRNLNFSLIAGSDAVRTAFGALDRHQQVTLRGTLVRNFSTQPHIRVEALTPGEKWDSGIRTTAPAAPPVDLERALRGRTRLRAMVHALDEERGGMLVVEFAGEVVPVVVPEDAALREQVKSLYRGDRIEFGFRIRRSPDRPPHLELAGGNGNRAALAVTDRIREQHGQERTVEGRLVVFPKSPALRRTIYGVEEQGPDGLHRYYTIFNFQDLKDQDRTDAALKAAWQKAGNGFLDGRNKYVHPTVRVRVTGRVNNPAPNQANPALQTDSSRVEVL